MEYGLRLTTMPRARNSKVSPASQELPFSGSSDGKESTCNAGDLGLIPGLGRSPGERNGSPLQYSCLENSIDRPMELQSQTRLSDFHKQGRWCQSEACEGLKKIKK